MSKIHLTRDDIKYTSNPVGNLVPEYVGQYCITDDNKIFFSNGLTSQDWIKASGDKEELDDLSARVEEVFQCANNGKQLIANVIGNESITGDSTYSAMSEAIKLLKEASMIPDENESYKEILDTSTSMLHDLMIEGGYDVNNNMTLEDMIGLIRIKWNSSFRY